MRIKISMATLATTVSLLLAVGTAQAAGNAQNGATLFASKCQSCHGAQGKDGSAPALNPVPASFDSVAPTMPLGGTPISASDQADIKAYLTSLSGGGGGATQATTGTTNPATTGTAPSGTVPATATHTGSPADLMLWAGGVALLGGAAVVRRRRSAED